MKRFTLLALSLLLLTGCSIQAHAGDITPTRIREYNTGDDGELITTIPVKTTDGTWRVLFCIDLGDAPPGGEILSVNADYQVTNNLGYNVSLVSHLIFTTGCTQTDGGEISEANGENITANMHHGVPTPNGSITVEIGNSREYVVLAVYAASTAATTGAVLKVDQDYGRMSVIRYN